MKNKNISRACLAAALMAGTVSAHASALRSSAPETEAAVMIMDNTRMARPKAKIVKEYAPTNRPAESERLFRSEAVEAEIARIKGVLDAKGIHAWVDFWGYDVDHDWGWWYKQVEYYLPFLLGKR